MTAVIRTTTNDSPLISYDEFSNFITQQYDGVVFVNNDPDVEGETRTYVGVYISGEPEPRLMYIDDEGGTILFPADREDLFPIRRAPPGLTVTFSN